MPNDAIAADLVIVGSGPAGLSAAIEARRLGLGRVLVLDREREAGGIPRHCGHPPYGVREFGRVMTGPAYARRVLAAARQAGAEVRTGVTVTALRPGPRLSITSDAGVETIASRQVILATGARETPRAARLVGGTKPGGVMNTGTLQGFIYLKDRKPFRRPLIVGTELVAFSAILTCRHAGIHPVAMVEPGERTTARWPCGLFPRLFGIPLWTRTSVEAVEGTRWVEGVVLRGPDGERRRVECDGAIFTGGFRPDAVLVRNSHLDLDPGTGGPAVDQFGRTSDPAIFAAGNLLRPIETAGWSFREGRAVAAAAMRAVSGDLPAASPNLDLKVASDALAFALPQRIVPGERNGTIQLRLNRPVRGRLCLRYGGADVASMAVDSRAERRVLMPLSAIPADATGIAQIAVIEDAQ